MTKVSADTLEELADKLEDVDAAKALATLRAFNAAVRTDIPFDPNVKDGRGTERLSPSEVQLGQPPRSRRRSRPMR